MGELASIPSMTALLRAAERDDDLSRRPREVVSAALRDAVSALRERVRSGSAAADEVSEPAILSAALEIIRARRARRLARVINATGVVLHTGLGRSVLPAAAVERLANVAAGYCSLEIDLDTGERGRRGDYVEQLLRDLTRAEAALVVNNNAAATMLVLHGLAAGREVIVSRGQLIEIGGSYRLPEVMAGGGAILREVGTTNKTHLRDYEQAIGEKTGLIMHVHTSNYRVVGFSQSPSAAELVALAHARGLPMFDDLGSGALLEDALWQSANEPTVTASLRNGADVVSFSGDKLLGGPQAGILLGRREIIEGLRKDAMARALRIDKLTIAALEAVLELYQDPAAAQREIPLLAALHEPVDALRERAERLLALLSAARPGDTFEARSDESFAGGGSLPAWPLPTWVVCWRPAGISVDDAARRLRMGVPAVLARIADGAVVFDMRAVCETELELLVECVRTLAYARPAVSD